MVAAYFLVLASPTPDGIAAETWRLLAAFVGIVVGFIIGPLPMGAMAICGVAVAVLTNALPLNAAFAGFGHPVVWLIVAAFLIARSLVRTGLSQRLALALVSRLGSSPLRIAYALAICDLVLAPFIPSDTARAGGIVYPAARSLAEANGSAPGQAPGRLGRYLMQSTFHVGITTAAMFVTAMSANPLLVELAQQNGAGVITWNDWALAAALPGVVAVLVIPALLYRLDPPTLAVVTGAREAARDASKAMGPLSSTERRQLCILVGLVIGWVSQPLHGFPPVVVAYAGVAAALVLNVIRWSDVLEEQAAWHTLVWFGAILALAQGLNEQGLFALVAKSASGVSLDTDWRIALAAIVVVYVLTHYAFASMTAHIATLYPIFLAYAIGSGVPATIAALALAFFSSLGAATTHYGTGSAPVLFGAGYVPQGTWWRNGAAVLVVQAVIWLGIGVPWWIFLFSA